MADCKWMQDEICVNADRPLCADYCPVVDAAWTDNERKVQYKND